MFIALAGLALSLVNSAVLLFRRRLRLSAEYVTVIPRADQSMYLDLVLSNASSLPVSINGARIFLRRGKSVSAKSVDYSFLDNIYPVPGGSSVRKSVRLASLLPIRVEPYTSGRIVLEFSLRNEVSAQVCNLQSRRSPRLKFLFSTSRGALRLSLPARFVPAQNWLRDFR